VSDPQRTGGPHRPSSTETVGTLVWLLDANSVDRRRHAIVRRLRALRDSDEFETLPGALRERVKEILADEKR
jgi:hypothetical protein